MPNEASVDDDQSFRLRPVIPIPNDRTAFTSWVGGRPCMAKSEPWPKIAGKPLQFICQLDCTALPADLWGGSGPREGWLIVFAGGSKRFGARIVHVDALGPERKPPKGKESRLFSSLSHKAPDDFDLENPRWPVEVEPLEAGPLKRDTGPLPPSPPVEEINDPLNCPHDWNTLILLFEAAFASLEQRKKWSEGSLQNAQEKSVLPDPDVSVPRKAVQMVRAMRERLEAVSASKPFDPVLWEPFIRDAITLKKLRISYDIDNAEGAHSTAGLLLKAAKYLRGTIAETSRGQAEKNGLSIDAYLKEFEPEAYQSLQKFYLDAVAADASLRRDRRFNSCKGERRFYPGTWQLYAERNPARVEVHRRRLDRLHSQLLAIALTQRPVYSDRSIVLGMYQPTFPADWDQAHSIIADHEKHAIDWCERAERAPEERRQRLEGIKSETEAYGALDRKLAPLTEKARTAREAGDTFNADDWQAEFNQITESGVMKNDVGGYIGLRFAMLMKAYTKHPDSLPAELREHCIARWRHIADSEVFKLGGPITSRIEEVINAYIDGPVMLLDFPSSNLLHWMWGDAENLVILTSDDELDNIEFGSETASVAPPS